MPFSAAIPFEGFYNSNPDAELTNCLERMFSDHETGCEINYYQHYRLHQLQTYGDSGLHIKGKSARQFTGGGAAYGYHAIAAHNSAKMRIHFNESHCKTGRK